MNDRTIRPMNVVLGGIPDLADIVGRERAVDDVLRSFHGHGALLTGDRRYGKTSLARLVEAKCRRRGDLVVRVSAERTSFEDFVAALADELAKLDSAFQQAIKGWSASFAVGPLKAERTASAYRSLDTLVRTALSVHPNRRLVLALDEIPILAQSMESREPTAGGELLHLLRRLRQDGGGRLVMVLSGSIGFHHVTHDALGATNDIERVPVGGLAMTDAIYLARCLLLGEGVPTTDERAVAEAIADAAECVPYYVHHLVKSARDSGERWRREVAPADVPRLVDEALVDPEDPWDLRHYRDRIRTYYGLQAALVSDVLDVYAAADDKPVSVDDVIRMLAALRADPPGRQDLLSLVERLEADHYLVRIGNDDRFASALVRRAWLAFQRR